MFILASMIALSDGLRALIHFGHYLMRQYLDSTNQLQMPRAS